LVVANVLGRNRPKVGKPVSLLGKVFFVPHFATANGLTKNGTTGNSFYLFFPAVLFFSFFSDLRFVLVEQST